VSLEYVYRALDGDGEVKRGTLNAEDRDTAADRLRRQGLRPIAVDRRRLAVLHREHRLPGSAGKRAASLALFARQFATMVRSGTPLLHALDVLARQADNPSLAEAIVEVRADVENGDQVSAALGHRPDWFDDFVVSMIEAGEQAGNLPDVLERLAQTTERSAELRRKVRRALAYPVAVGGLILLTVVAMLVFIVPTFTEIYDDLDGELPLPTRVVTGLSNLLTSNLVLIAVLTASGIVGLRRWKRTPAGRLWMDRLKLRLPVLGPLVSRTALARFARTLSVLVSSGVPIASALRIAGATSGNEVLRLAVDEVAERVTAGARISDSMEEHEVFSPMVVQMVRVGEETGALEDMLARVTDLFDDEVNTTVESLTASLEPLLIVAMGVIVGAILLSVYLPMFRAIDLVK
jgi:type IV pilus assembly protein PilC